MISDSELLHVVVLSSNRQAALLCLFETFK
jgi:hypothetical protein